MNVAESIVSRKSVRGFINQPVDREVIERILDVARYAPSGANSQPWQVAVVTGKTREKLTQRMVEAFDSQAPNTSDYTYYPLKWKEPYKRRRIDCGVQLYETLGIERSDRQKRMEQWRANYRGFGAPVMLMFFLDSSLATGSYLDYGMFIQSVMLAAQEEGLATCTQAALCDYAALVKEELGYPEDSVLLCGMSMGYEDREALVNSYRTPRDEVEVFTRFFT